ncbi:type I-E CRISPR-associated protein Cse1/CasA [Micrococcales bacterium 31B]|nr:type I-E CRISPR-associated protein Cse1/CasA [Micrococcales bacterium 31B]
MNDSFNLMHEPWITVTWLDGTTGEVSIGDALQRSEEIRAITEELPTQSFAELRLLLAIVHYAVRGPQGREHWLDLWTHGFHSAEFDEDLKGLAAYTDLLDLERPFMQVANLHSTNGEIATLERLIADVPNGFQFQFTRSGESLASLSYAEAARWLVHCHAFDPSGIKSAAVGDPLAKGGKGYPIGQAWSGYLGGVFVNGRNLRETLILNLVPLTGNESKNLQLQPMQDEDFDEHALGFSREGVSSLRDDFSLAEPDQAPSRECRGGAVALYTWLSRRVRLVASDGRITGVILSQGDKRTPQNGHTAEPMSGWRYSEPQSKRYQADVYMPLEHNLGEAFWRSITSILPSQQHVLVEKKNVQARLAPAVLRWMGEVSPEIGRHRQLNVTAVGMEYGPQSATVAEIKFDEVDLRLSMLESGSVIFGDMLRVAVQDTRDLAFAYARFEQNLLLAAVAKTDSLMEGVRTNALFEAMRAFDAPMRRWLADLDPQGNAEQQAVHAKEALKKWRGEAKVVMTTLRDDRIYRATATEISGRKVSDTEYVNCAIAQRYLDFSVKKITEPEMAPNHPKKGAMA